MCCQIAKILATLWAIAVAEHDGIQTRSHTRTKQVNGKGQNSTPRRSSQKLAGVITSWTAPGMQNFIAIGSRVSVPQIRDFAVLLGWLYSMFVFGFFNKATAYTPVRIFTQNTSNDVVPGKEVPFGGPDDYILYLDPLISENRHFGDRFWLHSFFAAENRFNMGML